MNMLRLLSQVGLWVGCCAIAACSAGGGGGGGGGGAPVDDAGDAGDDGATLEAGEVTAEFPTEGDSLVMLEEAETGATATFDGAVDPDTGEVALTSFTMTSDEATLKATLDDEQQPTELTIGTQVITADYNADGTVNYELYDGDELLDSGANVVLEDVDLEAKRISVAGRGAAARDDDDPHNIRYWAGYVARGWVADAIAARGYPRPNRNDLYGHPLYKRIQSDPLVMEQAYSIATMTLFGAWMRSDMYTICKIEHPEDDDYCKQLDARAWSAYTASLRLAKYVGATYADSFWDDPDSRCGPDSPCPSGFVCDAGHCVPKCTGPDDCPEGRKTCQADGLCVAEADDDDEAPPDGDGDDDLPPDDGGGDGGAISPALEEMIGCWEVTGDSLAEADPDEEFEFRAFVFDIDDEGQLDTVWAKLYVPENGWTVYLETVRFLEENSGVIGIEPGSATQSITADGDDINISFSFEAEEEGEIQVRGLDIRDIVVHASGDSWSSLNASGTFFEGDTSGAEAIPNVEGQRITCLLASREDVISQAEIEEMAEDEECGEGILAMMPVLFLGFAGMKLRRS